VYKLFNYWRYYSLGREQYHLFMSKECKNNMYSLRFANIFIIIMITVFACYSILIKRNVNDISIFIYVVTDFIALLLAIVASIYIQLTNNHKRVFNKTYIYLLTVIYFLNLIFFGLYISVWADRDNYAVGFMILLICSLILFSNSPILNICLTLTATAVFIISTVLYKTREIYIIDIFNVFFSTIMSIFACWRLTMQRSMSDLKVSKMENERNKYLEESTIDVLTKLRNRRDFMQTFHRYLVNYREGDVFLCLAIADIDFFKNYNDHYGHPKGDDCLCAIGEAFNRLKETMGVYCARVGGEEFALLWFEKEDISHVNAVISRVTKLIHLLKIPHEKSSVSKYVTMSLGVYVEKCGASSDTEEMYNLADKALYSAKESGRNCAIIRGRIIKEYRLDPEKNQ
jgi:diguanylate cyclase (GGDEF)-like protein